MSVWKRLVIDVLIEGPDDNDNNISYHNDDDGSVTIYPKNDLLNITSVALISEDNLED